MDEKLSLLKLKIYLSFSSDTKQQKDQRHLPVEDNKYRILTGPPIYASGMTILRYLCGEEINPATFYKRLDHTNQSVQEKPMNRVIKNTRSNWGWNDILFHKATLICWLRGPPWEGDRGESVQGITWNLLRKLSKERQGHSKKVCPRMTRKDRAEPPGKI